MKRNERFGKHVQWWRSQKIDFDDERGRNKLWTQEKLAQESGLSPNIIRNIEQGKVRFLEPHLEPLAKAFKLTEIQKIEFYAKAGLTYHPPNISEKDREYLKQQLEKIHFPTVARTPVWDIIAFNEYHRIIWGYTEKQLKLLKNSDEGIGANLLRVRFDPAFSSLAPTPNRRPEVIVWAFRSSSAFYSDTERYGQILKYMRKFDSFNRAWQLSENLFADQIEGTYLDPITRIATPSVNTPIEYMSLRIPERYFGTRLDISVYIPTALSEATYQNLRTQVKKNEVYSFKEYDLE